MQCLTVLGAAGQTFGASFYQSLQHYREFLRDAIRGHDKAASNRSWWQFVFDDPRGVPFADADLWEDEVLSLADYRAYPLAWRVGLQQSPQRPDSRQLDFLEAIAWALAATTEEEIDSGRWSKQVETFLGKHEVALSLPELLNPPSRQAQMQIGFVPDRRAMESTMAPIERYFREHPAASIEEANEILNSKFVGPMDKSLAPPATPLEQAQELCYEAFEIPGRRAVQLARKALAICPDCADAYVILAEHTNPRAAIALYEQGVLAGERSLGADGFQENAGHFWGVSTTRPYMRARAGLAHALRQAGRTEEAIEHFQELLRLNPNDNQGNRDSLLSVLLESGRDTETATRLKQYKDGTAIWAYGRALLAFRLSGRSVSANAELRTALRANPFAAEFLTNDEVLPQAEAYQLGSPEEGVYCARELRGAFANCEGATAWLQSEFGRFVNEQEKRVKERHRKEREKKRKRKK